MDQLLARLCAHHFDLAPPSLRDRHLPVVISKYGTIFVPKHKPAPTVIRLPGPKRHYGVISPRTQDGVLAGPASLRMIAEEVCAKHCATLEDLVKPSKAQKYVRLRWEFYFRARKETDHSFSRIGRFVGITDHTTILKGLKQYAKLVDIPYPKTPPRPRKIDPIKCGTVTACLRKDTFDRINSIARERSTTKAEVLRELVEMALSHV